MSFSKRNLFSQLAKCNRTVLQVAILADLDTRADTEEELISRLAVFVMAASSSSAATVKPSDHSSPAEETEQETEFCRGFKDAEAFVKVGGSSQCVNVFVSAVITVNTSPRVHAQ